MIYIYYAPEGRSCDQHVSHYHVWNDNEISNDWTTNWKQVYCNLRERVAVIFLVPNVFAELHGQNDCSERDSLHTLPKHGCCKRKVLHLCMYRSAAEEMALEQVDGFNYAVASNNPWGLRELLLVNGNCPGTNLRTSRWFQKHPGLQYTGFLVILQWSVRTLQEPEAIGSFWNQLRHFCKCAVAGAYFVLQQWEMDWDI